MKRLAALLILALIVVGGIYAIRVLPWWVLVVAGALVIFVVPLIIKKALKAAFLAPFKAKGAALHGATITVHKVTPTEAPPKVALPAGEAPDGDPDAEDDGEPATESRPDVPRAHFLLEVSIIPPAASGTPVTHWEPGELRLVRLDAAVGPDADDEDDVCEVGEIHYEENGEWKVDDGIKLPGPQRLRLQLAVREGFRRLKFQYYFESFGEVALP